MTTTIDISQLLGQVKPIASIQWIGDPVVEIQGMKYDDATGKTLVATRAEHKLDKDEMIYISGVSVYVDGFYSVIPHPNQRARVKGFCIDAIITERMSGGVIHRKKTYPVYDPDNLPEKFLIRFKKAQVERMKALESVAPEKARATLVNTVSAFTDGDEESDVDKEALDIVKGMAGDGSTITWEDLATFSAQQAVVARKELEALCQMPEGHLMDMPASVVQAVYSQVSEALEAVGAEGTEEESEATDESKEDSDPLETTEKPPTRRRRKTSTDTSKES